jgi:hypothetical protein
MKFVVCMGKGRKRRYWTGTSVTTRLAEAERYSWRFDAAKDALVLWDHPSFASRDWYVQEIKE